MLFLWFVGCFSIVDLIFSPIFPWGCSGSFGVCFLCSAVFLGVFFCVFLDADIPVESDTDDDGAPRISLAEMLEDLHISEDATGGEGAEMLTE